MPSRVISYGSKQPCKTLQGAKYYACLKVLETILIPRGRKVLSKHSGLYSGKERYCSALDPNYFGNCIESHQKRCPSMAMDSMLAMLLWKVTQKETQVLATKSWFFSTHIQCSQMSTPRIVMLGGMLSCHSVIEMCYLDPTSLAKFPVQQVGWVTRAH